MAKVKLALIQCPGWGRECPPFSLACLAAYARSKGHEVRCHDLNNALYHEASELDHVWRDKDYYSFWENPSRVAELVAAHEPFIDAYVDRILAEGARVAGFTTHTTSYLVSLEIARRLKRKDPSIVVVFGGPQCSREQAAFRFAADPAVDAVAVGEGEETLVALLEVVARDGRAAPLPGLILRHEGRVVDCGDRPLLADIGALPFPDYSDFADDIRARRYADPSRLEIFDSRGCVRTCDFCSEWQYWKRFRTMSGERMFAELAHQKRLFPQVDYFYFIGSLVNGSMKDLRRFCERLIASGIKVRWAGQAIVNPAMDEEMLALMAAAGCVWLGFGVESGSEAVRWRINKKFTNENAFKTLKAAHSAGIATQINVMFGMPTETREDFQETLKFLVRNRHHIDTVLASQSFTVIDKNTALHADPGRFGVTGQDHHLYWDSNEGANDYAERFRRYEEFCELALQLRIPETSGVLRAKPDKWRLLGDFYAHKRLWTKAVACYRRSIRLEGVDAGLAEALDRCYEALGRQDRRGKWTSQSNRRTPATPISA